jgi:hypothetical protein
MACFVNSGRDRSRSLFVCRVIVDRSRSHAASSGRILRLPSIDELNWKINARTAVMAALPAPDELQVALATG